MSTKGTASLRVHPSSRTLLPCHGIKKCTPTQRCSSLSVSSDLHPNRTLASGSLGSGGVDALVRVLYMISSKPPLNSGILFQGRILPKPHCSSIFLVSWLRLRSANLLMRKVKSTHLLRNTIMLVCSGKSSLFEPIIYSDTHKGTLNHSSAGSSQGTRICWQLSRSKSGHQPNWASSHGLVCS
jgi:hypothetical protein